jgi:ABC-2 type transport system permease protein
MDLNALSIPIVTGKMGNQPQQSFLPWAFFPLLSPTIKHPIINNLNSIKTEFISTLDTIGQKNIKKTILLTSSKYSRVLNPPVPINLNMLRRDPDERMYNKSFLPVAVLLEGKFESVFKNRIPPEIYEDKSIGFKEVCAVNNKMIVISDGDIIRNQIQMENGNLSPLPLGYDRYTRQQFGNKDFILNCIDYLCDESGLISVRSRELKLRMLDIKIKKSEVRIKAQLMNVIAPLLLIIIFGIFRQIYRKRKYSTKK